ncbi:hypothetical protein SELMODRAFT_136051 [Selaginella moellendorffii]|uniref:Peptidase A1 domain-containing protein n=1 Tax=Selaginella moellendorffii TaxID=88036 RepID=D8TB74_SELML|nr:aspartyl protease family protein 2 [Selaginella moellendorffii]EFJ06135.1 hypothetical protein SELMODRAFT_136051 [Selaginella moellendorffii]|eukprot:XP_002992845.1 aspartyl protease family protein 2 [Selaginella moellendorffii]
MQPSKPLLLLFVLIRSTVAAAAAHSLDVRSVLEASDGSTSIGFSVVHRDAPRSKLRDEKLALELDSESSPTHRDAAFKDVIQYVQARQARVAKHRRSKHHHHHHRHHHHHHHHRNHGKNALTGFTSPVVTLGQAGLEYYVPLQLGTPAVEVVLIMDTGSDVSWIQCVPCKDCVPALRPPFNPRHSSSFFKLPCASSTCTNVYQGVKPFCSPSGRTCLFSIQYGDGSLSSGLLAMETIAGNTPNFGDGEPVKLSNITLGCADIDREGLPTGASGLLGMDRRPISFPSQLSSRYARKFSHCFPDKIAHLNSSGLVFFGESDIISPYLRYTPLVQNPAVPSASLDYYYVGLVGISVDESRLPLSHKNFDIDKVTGSGGTIIDSGTAFTYLKKPAFQAMRREFLARTSHLAKVDDNSGFTPCYNITSGTAALESTILPSITLHFRGGLDVVLPKNSILIPVSSSEEQTTLCLAFQMSGDIPFNIIGNYQQQNLWVEYDLEKLRLGIAPAQCATD